MISFGIWSTVTFWSGSEEARNEGLEMATGAREGNRLRCRYAARLKSTPSRSIGEGGMTVYCGVIVFRQGFFGDRGGKFGRISPFDKATQP